MEHTESNFSRAESAGPPKAGLHPSGVVRAYSTDGGCHEHSPHRRPGARRLFRRAGLPSIVRAQARAGARRLRDLRTGPWTTGAQVSQEPNYLLWAEQQNAAGGLNVKGRGAADRADRQRRPEQHRTCVRTYEKLMGSDKVDLVLPPWGSNANFAGAAGQSLGLPPSSRRPR